MMSSRRNAARFLLALLVCLPGAAALAEDEIRIGLIAPITGPLRDLGASCKEGALLGVKEVNRAGGIVLAGRRHTLVLLVKDSQERPEWAVSSAQELINQDRVSVIIGPPTSGQAIPVARLAERAGIPMVTPIATNPEVTRGKLFVFRACYTDDVQGGVMARFAWDDLGARSAALLYDIAADYPRGIADYFSAEFRRLGGRVMAESYTTGAADFRAQIGRVRARKTDVLLLPNYLPDLRLQLDQFRELGGAGLVLGTDTMGGRGQEDLDRIGHAYFSTHFSPDIPTEKVRAFVAAYQAAFNRIPTAPAGALTYDTVLLVAETIRRAGSADASAFCKGLRDFGVFEGVTGVMAFNGNPDPRRSVVIVEVRDGRLSFHTRIDP